MSALCARATMVRRTLNWRGPNPFAARSAFRSFSTCCSTACVTDTAFRVLVCGAAASVETAPMIHPSASAHATATRAGRPPMSLPPKQYKYFIQLLDPMRIQQARVLPYSPKVLLCRASRPLVGHLRIGGGR